MKKPSEEINAILGQVGETGKIIHRRAKSYMIEQEKIPVTKQQDTSKVR